MTWTIDDRLWLLLKAGVAERHTWKALWDWLGSHTAVSAGRWRNFYSGHQKAAAEMIEAAAKIWPQHAFWLATGISDVANGHVAPSTAFCFPEHSYLPDEASRRYFTKSLEINEVLFSRSGIDASDDETRRASLERVNVFGTWTGSGIVQAAYSLAGKEIYTELRQDWEQRESEREAHLKSIRSLKPAKSSDQTNGSIRLRVADERTSHQHDFDLFYAPRPAR